MFFLSVLFVIHLIRTGFVWLPFRGHQNVSRNIRKIQAKVGTQNNL